MENNRDNKNYYSKCKEFDDLRKTFYVNNIALMALGYVFSICAIALCFLPKVKNKIIVCAIGVFLLIIAIVKTKVTMSGPDRDVYDYLDRNPDIDIEEMRNDKKYAEKVTARLFIGKIYTFFVLDGGEVNIVLNKDIIRAEFIIQGTRNVKPHLVLYDKYENEYKIYIRSIRLTKQLAERYNAVN